MEPKSIDRIFWDAGRIASSAEREVYLQSACAGDIELRERVEQLLQARPKAESFFESASAPQRIVSEPPLHECSGMLIGPYRLCEQIGEGGFGVVYLAEQTQPVRRKVALKLIKPGMDTKQVIARFEAERQALALMDHPNIAKVFDAGTTDSGRPYFVMELVRGVPVTDYCDQCNLTTRERLELFVAICHAVQHAHQKGVIHRDLKPTNVLVSMRDGRAAPKIIDFGVAKAINQPLTERTHATGFAQMLGTPLYMSPEQAELSPLGVDTRTDIYSLGVLLYELVTGATPFERERLQTASFDELRRIIREEEPPCPSARISTLAADLARTVAERRRTDARRLLQSLRGDVDCIVSKALEKDRNRRYESANSLAQDIEHYLNGEPVLARPASRAYLLRKFVGRNRGPVLSVCLVLLALVGGIIGTTWGMIRAEQARENAVSARLAEARLAEGERRAKEEAQKRLAQITLGTETLASIFRDVDPLAAEREGVTQRDLLARRLNEAAEQLDGEAIGDPLVGARLQHVLGVSLHQLGYPREAEAVLVKACRTRSALLGADHLDTVATKHHLASIYRSQGKSHLAETLYNEALESRTARLGPDHSDTLESRHHLAMLYQSQRRFALAEATFQEIIGRRTATLGADHSDTLTSRHRLALLYRSRGDYDLAETQCREVLALRTASLGSDHLDTLASKHLLGVLSFLQGKPAVAETLYKEVLALRTAKLGPDHPDTLSTQHYLALLYGSTRDFRLSIPLLEQTLVQRKAKLGPDNVTTLRTQLDLGAAYRDAGRFGEAIALLQEVHAKRGKHALLRPSVAALMKAHLGAGEASEATVLAAELMHDARQEFPGDAPEVYVALVEAARAFLQLGRYADAEPTLREALSRAEHDFDDTWRIDQAKLLLGEALLGQEKFAEAEPLLLASHEAFYGRNEREFATEAVRRLVQLYDAWGQPDKAAEWRERLGEGTAGSEK